ncbi:hypothetical protein [Mycobacterium sp.]|uniref:hypothetical protein n=1 Tax=Mycobacterium sp. TaxID=1785 RepID=UPI000CBD4630|nr:hypothetical protein [Mycobacterium sp.]PJE01593.1 MAG: hypothetical protein CK428_31025 [Mycobacterium sp.]
MTTTRRAPLAHRITEYLAYQFATRPRLRRIATLGFTSHLLMTWALVSAPQAAASTLTGALNWTGVTDSHGVPVGNYYLSVVTTSEAISKAGPELTTDPTSWTRWLANAVTTGLTHEIIVETIQSEAALYIFMVATSLWLLRFAMSNTWIYWLANWFRPLFEVLRSLLTELWVFPLCILAGLAVGAYHMLWHGRKGYGAGITLSAFVIGILGMVLTRDPLSDLSNDNGLLGQARALGFKVAQAFANNGPITGGGTNAQLQHLTGLIADATLRTPLQLMNFGTTVDDIGGCGNAYTAAILGGKPDGPAHAMGSCGAQQALAFAQHLNGANLALGVFYLMLGAVFTFFVLYATYSYVMVCCAAFINALIAVAAAAPAMIHGQPRKRALRRLSLFFKHALLVFVYTTYISVAAVIVLKMAARGGYADQVGMSHPLARLIMIGLIAAVAIGGLRWLKRELGDHTRRDITHLVNDLNRTARRGYEQGRDRVQQARTLALGLSGAPTHTLGTTSAKGGGQAPDDPPLTGPPVPGRPPGGRPLSSSKRTPPPATQADRAARGHTATAQAGATAFLAPEAAAAAAITSRVTQGRQRGANQRSAAAKAPHPYPGNAAGNGQLDPRHHGADQAPPTPEPVAGRAGTGIGPAPRHADGVAGAHLPFENPPVRGRG